MGTGSREENASKQETGAPFRLNRNGKGSTGDGRRLFEILITRDRPALAALGGSAYLGSMARSLPTEQEIVAISPSSGGIQSILTSIAAWGAAGFGAVALLGAFGLWFHYGTAVFFEMIASGLSSCF